MTLRKRYIAAGAVLAVVSILYFLFFAVPTATEHKVVEERSDAESEAIDSVEHTLGISPYDIVFRRAGRKHNVDWRLLAAMAYAESHFRSNAISSKGAIGVMQVMPHIARSFGVDSVELADVAVNIDVGARIYRSMRRMLQLPKDIHLFDATAFTVASYNCGASRIIDARRLAEYYDDDANDWSIICDYLSLLSEEEFYNHEAVQGGRFGRASTTIAYVERVMEQYDKYCRRVKQ